MARFSFNTLNHSVLFGLAPNLPEQIEAAAAAGYDDIGIDLGSVLAHEQAGLSPAALGALVRDAGLACYELAVLRLAPDPATARDALTDVLRIVDGVHPGVVYAITIETVDDAVVAAAREAAVALRAAGTTMAIEFVAGFGVATIDQALALAEAAGDDVGVVVDTWQLARTGGRAADVAALPRERLAFLQLADSTAEPSGPVEVEMSQGRVLPGEGMGFAPEVCQAARASGFDGHLSIEVLSAEWRARPPAELAAAALGAARAAWDGISAPAR